MGTMATPSVDVPIGDACSISHTAASTNPIAAARSVGSRESNQARGVLSPEALCSSTTGAPSTCGCGAEGISCSTLMILVCSNRRSPWNDAITHTMSAGDSRSISLQSQKLAAPRTSSRFRSLSGHCNESLSYAIEATG